MGLQARLMSQALRKLTGIINKSDCVLIFINQLRANIGNAAIYGPSETTTGGRALKFYASIRMDVRRSDYLKVGSEIVGNRVKVKIAKNKVAPPFKVVEFDIMYGKGISHYGDILDLSASIDIVNKSGAWYSYNGKKIGQGRENAKNYLAENPEIALEIENAVRKHYELDSLDEMEHREKEKADEPVKNSSEEDSDDDNKPLKLPDLEDEDAIDEDFDDEFGGFNDDLSDIVINE